MVSTPTTQSDKDMKIISLHVSDTDIVDSNAMARAIQSHTLWLLFAKREYLCYIPAHSIMVRSCDASQWLLFACYF